MYFDLEQTEQRLKGSRRGRRGGRVFQADPATRDEFKVTGDMEVK